MLMPACHAWQMGVFPAGSALSRLRQPEPGKTCHTWETLSCFVRESFVSLQGGKHAHASLLCGKWVFSQLGQFFHSSGSLSRERLAMLGKCCLALFGKVS